MKFLNCVVLLMSVLLIYGEELSDDCRFEMLAKSYEADACIAKVQRRFGSIEQLIEDFNQTVVHYNGNEVDYASVDPIIDRFLNIVPQYCDCVLAAYEYSADCPRLPKSMVRKMYLEQVAVFMSSAQKTNGDKIKKLIPHNGLELVLSNKDIEKCASIVSDIPNMDQYCSALGRAHQCAVQTIGNHPNEYVITIIEEFITLLKRANNC